MNVFQPDSFGPGPGLRWLGVPASRRPADPWSVGPGHRFPVSSSRFPAGALAHLPRSVQAAGVITPESPRGPGACRRPARPGRWRSRPGLSRPLASSPRNPPGAPAPAAARPARGAGAAAPVYPGRWRNHPGNGSATARQPPATGHRPPATGEDKNVQCRTGRLRGQGRRIPRVFQGGARGCPRSGAHTRPGDPRHWPMPAVPSATPPLGHDPAQISHDDRAQWGKRAYD